MAVVGDPRGFYEALGVQRTASPGEIRTAFRERAKLYHPDGGADADGERFRHLREAYEILRDPQRRLQYDADSLEEERRRDRARFAHGMGAEADRFGGAPGAGLGPGALARAGPLLPGVIGALFLCVLVAAGLAVWFGRDAAGLRGEVARLEAELGAARAAAARVEAPARERLEAASLGGGGDPTPVAGGHAVYEAGVTFPPRSAELDGGVQAQLQARVAELRAAISVLPPEARWFVLVDGHSGRAASGSGVAVEAWELALLRVATVTEHLVGAAVPPDRLAVRFLAGFAPEAPGADPSRDVALRLVCCEG